MKVLAVGATGGSTILVVPELKEHDIVPRAGGVFYINLAQMMENSR